MPSVGNDGGDADIGIILGVVMGVLLLMVTIFAALQQVRHKQRAMRPMDFMEAYKAMVDSGEIIPAEVCDGDAAGIQTASLPREIKRAHLDLAKGTVVGAGQFGQVWKAVLDETPSGGPPGYLVAAKTVLNSKDSPEARRDLEQEALVMAQVHGHENLVSLVGVVTCGDPLVLIVGYCEHGSLLSLLRKRAKQRDPLGIPLKLALSIDTARGMNHLVQKHFIHRDLAARNVLVATGMVGKVADFGLSRGTRLAVPEEATGNDYTDDDGEQLSSRDTPLNEAGEYYRSQAGVFPIRWTAPEAMETLRFSPASDVWSYGIVLVEIFQDGVTPYKGTATPTVMQQVMGGSKHPCPPGCPAEVYQVLTDCWALDPSIRPGFDLIEELLETIKTDHAAAAIARESLAAPVPAPRWGVKGPNPQYSDTTDTDSMGASTGHTQFQSSLRSMGNMLDATTGENSVEEFEYQEAVTALMDRTRNVRPAQPSSSVPAATAGYSTLAANRIYNVSGGGGGGASSSGSENEIVQAEGSGGRGAAVLNTGGYSTLSTAGGPANSPNNDTAPRRRLSSFLEGQLEAPIIENPLQYLSFIDAQVHRDGRGSVHAPSAAGGGAGGYSMLVRGAVLPSPSPLATPAC
jgi:serine/threonine protein kinase